MQPTVDVSYRASVTRELSGTAAAARSAVLRVVVVAGFRVESEQLTGIRAQRGSKLSGVGQKPEKLPIALSARFTDSHAHDSSAHDDHTHDNLDSSGCTVQVDLQDRWPGAFSRTPSVAGSYQAIFESIMGDIDSALAVLDPVAAKQFPTMQSTVPAGTVGTGGPGLPGQIIERANQALDSTPGSPRRNSGPSGAVVLVLPSAHTVLGWTDVQAMMTAGTMIATRPGGLPQRLARDVARVVGTLETSVPQAGPSPGTALIELPEGSRPVLDFLRLQGQMRAKLPLRTLQVCTTCRLEKVINPDFQRLQARNRKLRVLTSSIGGVISPHGISAFLLLGRLAQLKLLDPDFVCPRCQGMIAETSIITFCPRCGDRRTEAALRSCTACAYDLRTEVLTDAVWVDGPPELASPSWSDPAAGVPSAAAWPTTTVDPNGALAALPPPIPGTMATAAAPPPATARSDQSRPADVSQLYPPSAWPQPPQSALPSIQGGWHRDPHGRHEYRWWDGSRWTDQVADNGVAALES